jgi:O-antigen/teichoic acid export membrane protein
MDKILLSRILPLEEFGYYTLASVAGGALGVIVSPLFSAIFPRFSQLAVTGDQEALKRLYHKSCQVMAVLVLPPAMVLVLFSPEIMLLWTQNPTATENTWRLASLLVVGTALNGLMSIPYALQLAHGWTKLALGVNIVAIVVLVPLLVLLSLRWGALGAACVWPILNAGYLLCFLQLMHRRLLPGELWRWYWADCGLPLGASLAVCVAVRFFSQDLRTMSGRGAAIAVAGLFSLAAAVLVSGDVRAMLATSVKSWSSSKVS